MRASAGLPVNRHIEHGTERWAPRLNMETLREMVSPARGVEMCVPLVREIQVVVHQIHSVTVGQRFQQGSPAKGMAGGCPYHWGPSWEGQVWVLTQNQRSVFPARMMPTRYHLGFAFS